MRKAPPSVGRGSRVGRTFSREPGPTEGRALSAVSLGIYCPRLQSGVCYPTGALDQQALKYAIAWGLTHDVATWPMSHSSEPAFEHLTGWRGRAIREAMLTGHEMIPTHLRVTESLQAMQVDPAVLARFFQPDAGQLPAALRPVHAIAKGLLSPDTLEGMHRSAIAFGITPPDVHAIVDSFESRDGVVGVSTANIESLLGFWRAKMSIYQGWINRPEVIAFESDWALALVAAFSKLSLPRSFELREEELLERVPVRQPRPGGVRQPRPFKYKPPMAYELVHEAQLAKTPWVPLAEVSNFFVRRELKVG